MGFSKNLETVQEIIEELDEIAYLQLLEAHNMASLSKVGLWMPADFFRDIFLQFWADRETQSYAPWRQIAAVGSLLWLWLIANEKKLDQLDTIFLSDQKLKLFFLVPNLMNNQQISPYIKDSHMPLEISFDENKFAYRCLIQGLLYDIDDIKTTPLQ